MLSESSRGFQTVDTDLSDIGLENAKPLGRLKEIKVESWGHLSLHQAARVQGVQVRPILYPEVSQILSDIPRDGNTRK